MIIYLSRVIWIKIDYRNYGLCGQFFIWPKLEKSDTVFKLNIFLFLFFPRLQR